MNYKQAIRYLESFINYEKNSFWPYKESLKLERFRRFLETIGDPQDALRYLHVAGTKGKGSTCAFVAHILREAGYKVGLYTSPHLVTFRERIRILAPKVTSRMPKHDFEGMISKKDLSQLVFKLKPEIERYNKNSRYGPLSFFEVYTALAFVYFKQKKADFVVLETGLGGRLDATNVIRPLVCAITPISYEHTDKLGNTLKEIAAEKSGIIKNSCQLPVASCQPKAGSNQLIVISAPQAREAMRVISEKCKRTGARLYRVGKDIKLHMTDHRLCPADTVKVQYLTIKGLCGSYMDIKTSLIGKHQAINAAVAVGVADSLKNKGVRIASQAVNKGIYNTVWPGRCEMSGREPLIIMDGAQNVASASALKNTIREYFRYRRLILILGISRDKDVRGICNQFDDLADEVILTRADNPRATNPDLLKRYFQKSKPRLTKNTIKAIRLARLAAGKEDVILITGSLFVVGEARRFLCRNSN